MSHFMLIINEIKKLSLKETINIFEYLETIIVTFNKILYFDIFTTLSSGEM